MRISDWSSDVCSSDLDPLGERDPEDQGVEDDRRGNDHAGLEDAARAEVAVELDVQAVQDDVGGEQLGDDPQDQVAPHAPRSGRDRKRVVEGKSVSVRVELGGRRRIKQTKTKTN